MTDEKAALLNACSAVQHGCVWLGFDGPSGVTKDEALEYAVVLAEWVRAQIDGQGASDG